MTTNDENRRITDEDRAKAGKKGLVLVGFARTCLCGGRAFHSPKANWQNRVVCLDCGRKWSE